MIHLFRRRASRDELPSARCRFLVAGRRDEWHVRREIARELGLMDGPGQSLFKQMVWKLRGGQPTAAVAWQQVQERYEALKKRGEVVETDAYRERKAHHAMLRGRTALGRAVPAVDG